EVGGDGLLEHEVVVFAAVLVASDFLGLGGEGYSAGPVVAHRESALCHLGAYPGLGEECRDARATGPQLPGERALRSEFDFKLAGEELPLELLVLSHIRRRHLADATGGQQ